MSRRPLAVAVAQPRTTAYDVVANAAEHAAAVRAADARVVVFPELSLTGYELDAPALTTGDARLAPIVEACVAAGALALVGAPIRDDDGGEHIATLAVDGTGVRVAYRKVHVHESEERFRPGGGPAVIEVDGWRLGFATCRDTRFPAHDAATAALGMDVYLASVLDNARDADEAAGRALRVATERGVWVAMASFAGSTGGGFDQAAGGSTVWGRDGAVLARAGAQPGEIARAVLRD